VAYRRREANDSPACRITQAWYRDTATLRHRVNSENRISAAQNRFAAKALMSKRVLSPPKRLGRATTTVVWSFGCFGRVAEWQTRWLQVPVSFGTWGFKSPFAHLFTRRSQT
jgi:hypothetical protein